MLATPSSKAKLATRERFASEVYGALSQRVARFLHQKKAQLRAKERRRIEWLSQFSVPGNSFIDVGANFGYFAKEFAQLHQQSCVVLAFEPLFYNFTILQNTTSDLPNVHLYRLALSDRGGEAQLIVPVKERGRIGPALAHFGPEKTRDFLRETVYCVRFDHIEPLIPGTDIGLIKIDVEGAELLVLKGAEKTIRRDLPCIFVEINDSYTQRLGIQATEVFEFLTALGYRAELVEEEDAQFRLREALTYCGAGDYLFRHPG